MMKWLSRRSTLKKCRSKIRSNTPYLLVLSFTGKVSTGSEVREYKKAYETDFVFTMRGRRGVAGNYGAANTHACPCERGWFSRAERSSGKWRYGVQH